MTGTGKALSIGVAGLNHPPRAAMETHARRIEEAGIFDCLWTSDQLVLMIPRSIWTEDIVGPLAQHDVDVWMDPFISATVQGAVLNKTRVGVSVIDAVRRPPAVLAQSLLSLDHMVGGGSFFVLGGGERKQFDPYGQKRDRPMARLEDAVRFCKLLWNSQDPVTAEGNVTSLDRAVLALPPVDGEAPGVWVAGAGPRSLEIAGKYADGWIVWGPGPYTPEEYKEHAETIRAHAQSVGRSPDRIRFACLFAMVVIKEEAERALVCEHPIMKWISLMAANGSHWKRWGLQHPIGEDFAYMRDFCPQWWERKEALAVIERVPPEAVERSFMIGTPDELESRIQEYVDAGSDFLLPCPYSGGAVEGHSGRFGEEPGEDALWAMLRRLKARNTPTGTGRPGDGVLGREADVAGRSP